MFVVITAKIYWLFYYPVPGPVISSAAFSFGKDWIHLRWGAPYPPLGELEVYKVEYKLQSSVSYYIKEVSTNKTCNLWDGNICFRLNSSDGITGNEVYNIKVSDTTVISLDWELKCLLCWLWWRVCFCSIYVHNHQHNSHSKNVYIF